MNYYERHIGDWIKDTVALSMLEDGAYNRLTDQCYQTEQPLPLDIKEIYRAARATSGTERKAVDYVLAKYFDKGETGYVQKRIELEIERYADKQRKAKASADARWNKPKPPSGLDANASPPHDAQDMRTHSVGNAHQSPDTSPHLNTNQAALDPAFPDEKQPEPELPGLPKAQIPDCPHLKVLELWAEVLPALPQHNPEMWKGARADHLRARWRETSILKKWPDQDAGLAYFRKLFRYVGTSQFLTGQARSTDPSKRPFTIELEWLVNPSNWAKVHEGKYHTEA